MAERRLHECQTWISSRSLLSMIMRKDDDDDDDDSNDDDDDKSHVLNYSLFLSERVFFLDVLDPFLASNLSLLTNVQLDSCHDLASRRGI